MCSGGGVKAWFLDLSGKAKAGNETTHRVKLVIEPVGRNRKSALMADKEREKE
jgi:hypothetical protein